MEPEPALRFSVMQVKCSKPYPLEQDAAFLDERGACGSYVAKSVRDAGSSPWWHESCRFGNDGTACAQRGKVFVLHGWRAERCCVSLTRTTTIL